MLYFLKNKYPYLTEQEVDQSTRSACDSTGLYACPKFHAYLIIF